MLFSSDKFSTVVPEKGWLQPPVSLPWGKPEGVRLTYPEHVHRSRACPPLTGIAKIIDWKADIAQSKAVSCIITHSEAENSEAAQAQEEKADS